ncbi:glycine dehydrogenase (aminomethyl-transferring), partial [candidate division KSB1 bacterium]|nr:glycine dehydrogenase (aminomethyl-transferring) [candidate division KSB1 bacterium]
MNDQLSMTDDFANRHIGPDAKELEQMLKVVGTSSLDDLMAETIPADIRLDKPLSMGDGLTEYLFLQNIRQIAQKNQLFKSYIGLGFYDTITPSVILRNIFENPGWYTQYTPYQAEISQGRLEALLIFQNVVSDLTGLPVANASLLDEATAAAESMSMIHRLNSVKTKDAN